jgi:hypothetical protein
LSGRATTIAMAAKAVADALKNRLKDVKPYRETGRRTL